MKVLVTGGSGFVGSTIVRRFLQNNEEVYVTVRENSNLWRLQDIKDQLNLFFGDLSSVTQVEEIISRIKPETIINCSGAVRGFNLNDQYIAIQSNLINTVNLTNVALKLNIDNFIHTGSAYECGFSQFPISNHNCTGIPFGLYGIVKRAESEYIQMVSKKYKKNYLTLRLFTPYGFFDSPLRLIPYVITSLIFGKIPQIINPSSGRSFTFMNDISKIYYGIAKHPEKFYNSYIINVGSGRLIKVAEVVSTLFSMFGIDYEQEDTAQNDNMGNLYPDSVEIEELLSKLSVKFATLKEGLTATVRWFRENINYYAK